MESPDQISEQAIRLASDDRGAGFEELIRLAGGDIGRLEAARHALVGRLRRRSDDYAATKGLTLLNTAISRVGWPDPLEWQPRKWRIRR